MILRYLVYRIVINITHIFIYIDIFQILNICEEYSTMNRIACILSCNEGVLIMRSSGEDILSIVSVKI